MTFNERLFDVVEVGDERIMNKMIEFGADDFNVGLPEAPKKGNEKAV